MTQESHLVSALSRLRIDALFFDHDACIRGHTARLLRSVGPEWLSKHAPQHSTERKVSKRSNPRANRKSVPKVLCIDYVKGPS